MEKDRTEPVVQRGEGDEIHSVAALSEGGLRLDGHGSKSHRFSDHIHRLCCLPSLLHPADFCKIRDCDRSGFGFVLDIFSPFPADFVGSLWPDSRTVVSMLPPKRWAHRDEQREPGALTFAHALARTRSATATAASGPVQESAQPSLSWLRRLPSGTGLAAQLFAPALDVCHSASRSKHWGRRGQSHWCCCWHCCCCCCCWCWWSDAGLLV
mmetsp:Transcript_32039/g.68307  ORF Transcript_32039/g.68307 Transcript_32039/m.68307 type:complete len:211 (+) Transcript_32039:1571-2203(+)